MTEPAAAAIAFGYGKEKEGVILIFDLGGGTFDLAVVRMRKQDDFQILAYSGDTHLGGQDFDSALMDYIMQVSRSRSTCTQKARAPPFKHANSDITGTVWFRQDIRATMKVNMRDEPESLHELRQACELAKRKLSTQHQTDVVFFLNRIGKGYRKTVSRSKFEELCLPQFKKAISLLPEVLRQAKVRPPHPPSHLILIATPLTNYFRRRSRRRPSTTWCWWAAPPGS